MYRCIDCGEVFDEPESREFCYEDYCGVSSLFRDRHYGTYDACPECGSEEIEKVFEDEDEEE